VGSWGHSQQQGVGVPGAQVRQEQGADVGVLRYGHGATASGTRCVPNSEPCRLSKITGTWGKREY